ncbi:MAG: noncanonical pyrimidine nucleotidase, YjjG family [Chloroflexi bacterium]|nr:noncanonical pyrimidine nucleotidase, YjjG family [Chloroflexota bacterium]
MKYRWLLFDLDNTLFDFDAAELQALACTFPQFGCAYTPEIGEAYHRINHDLWQAFERGEITAVQLRTARFQKLFQTIGFQADPAAFSDVYLSNLAAFPDLIDGADELIPRLSRTHQLALITNGLSDVQRPRLEASPIGDYFTAVTISDEIGIAKPDAGIFDASFAAMGQPAKSDVLLIGDSLTSDIRGGVNYGIDTCWYNPAGKPNANGLTPTYEICHLHEMLEEKVC